jgi:hypothetical protein
MINFNKFQQFISKNILYDTLHIKCYKRTPTGERAQLDLKKTCKKRAEAPYLHPPTKLT